jgi:hypothetical protein
MRAVQRRINRLSSGLSSPDLIPRSFGNGGGSPEVGDIVEVIGGRFQIGKVGTIVKRGMFTKVRFSETEIANFEARYLRILPTPRGEEFPA